MAEQKKTNEELFDELPEAIKKLLKIHFSMIAEIAEKDTARLEFNYNAETKRLQFLTDFMVTPKLTTDNPIDYEEKSE